MKTHIPLLALLIAACASAPAPTITPTEATPAAAQAAAPPCNPALSLVDAASWFQSSAEYRAGAMQVYTIAGRALDTAIADPSWKALDTAPTGAPPAIILDLDETAINNSRFEAQMVRMGKTFDQDSWNRWVASASATAIPGAAAFLDHAHSLGVKIFYITNRRAAEEQATRENVLKLGYPLESGEDTLLTRGERPEWQSDDKSPRRDFVAAKYRVIMLLGDDLNDFTAALHESQQARDRIVSDNAANWGSKWFILPNPLYGSWQNALTGDTRGCEQLQKKIEALQP